MVFVVPTAFVFEKILPLPPAPGAVAALADLESVLQAQVWRTAEQVARAKAAEEDKGFNYVRFSGRGFSRRIYR